MVTLSSSSCLIFGASGGLGRPITEQLHAHGAKVVMAGRRFSRLAEVEADGPRIEVDVRDPASAAYAMSVAVEAHGQLDVVVNATGVVAFGSAERLSSDVLEELFLTNTFGSIFIAQAALNHVCPGGMIVNIPGVIAEKNLPNMAAYGASKAAQQAWDDAFRREARRAKIQVLDARPGHTETGLADRAIAGDAPAFPRGLDPAKVASIIVQAVASDQGELPSTAFT